jgi:hypothetical protein
MSDAPASPAILNAPLIGPLLRALTGPDAPLVCVLLVLVVGIALVAAFGYPALIVLALAGTFGMLGGLIVLTRAR